MPGTVGVLEASVFASLAEPERLVETDLDGVEPGIAWLFVGEKEDDVDFFQRAECGFGIEEVDERDDGKVCACEDDPGAVPDVHECDGRDEDDAVMALAYIYLRRGDHT